MNKDKSNLSGFWAEGYLSEDIINHKNNSTLHLFIIWEKSRDKSDLILDDLKNFLTIRQVYEIQWNKEFFLTNLKRFYERRLPEAQQKANLCGTGSFLAVLVSDFNPILKKMKAPNDEEDIVNMNIVESKMKYRTWIGKEFSIHSSISEKETNHDLTLLFGKNTNDLDIELPEKWNGSIAKIESDLVGQNGWNDFKQLLYVLNGTVNYVILRNFEGMPDKFNYNDVDLLTEDVKIRYVLDGNFSLYGDNISRLKMKVGDEILEFDFRYLTNQHYMDTKWLKDILNRRVFHTNGFYVPCKEDYFYSLLYHAIFHKGIISDKSKKRLYDLAQDLNLSDVTEQTFSHFNESTNFLKKYMKKMKYRNSNSFIYKLKQNEYGRLVKVSIFIAKSQGLRYLLGVIKHKIAITLHDAMENIIQGGKIIDKTDYDLKNTMETNKD